MAEGGEIETVPCTDTHPGAEDATASSASVFCFRHVCFSLLLHVDQGPPTWPRSRSPGASGRAGSIKLRSIFQSIVAGTVCMFCTGFMQFSLKGNYDILCDRHREGGPDVQASSSVSGLVAQPRRRAGLGRGFDTTGPGFMRRGPPVPAYGCLPVSMCISDLVSVGGDGPPLRRGGDGSGSCESCLGQA